MNILYIDHYAGSPEMGMEFRPYYLAREWVRMGHAVTIVAASFSHLRRRNPKVAEDFQTEWIDGIEYVWLKTGQYDGNGVRRACTMLSFVSKLWAHAGRIAKQRRPDIVIASSTYPMDTYAARRIARKAGARYIHEVHDMWPATLYEVGGMSRHHPFVIAMQVAENAAYRHCDRCVSLLPYAKDYMVRHGLQPQKFVNIQNGVAADEWEQTEALPEPHASFFRAHRGQFIVGYFGGHGLSNALDQMLDVAAEFLRGGDDENTIFVFVGDGSEKNRLVMRSETEHISNAFFLPPVSKKAIPGLLEQFSCAYMTGADSPLYRFGLCLNKMFDAMMAGLPIVCAFNAPDTLVRLHQCGYQCDPSDRKKVASAIRAIRSMQPEDRAQMGRNGRTAVMQHYTYELLAAQFLQSACEP